MDRFLAVSGFCPVTLIPSISCEIRYLCAHIKETIRTAFQELSDTITQQLVTERKMDITFSITYRAEWGQRLCVSGSIVELGNWDETNAIELSAQGEDKWVGTISVDGRRKDFTYYYLVKNANGKVLRREWKRMHRLAIKEPFRTVYMDDHWINRPANAPFYSSAFYDVLFRHEEQLSRAVSRVRGGEKLVIQIYAPTVPRTKRLYLSGNTPKSGQWDPSKAIELLYMGKGQWYISVEIDRSLLNGLRDFQFKFFIADEHRKGIRWEGGENRQFTLPIEGHYDAIYIAGLTFDEGGYSPRGAGVVAPIFSLRHQQDFGAGDFGSLRKAIDWAASARLHVVQLLPINDTTFYRDWRDSYPYNAISVDALHPLYADLSLLPPLRSEQQQRAFEEQADALRRHATMQYPEVMQLKEAYLRQHFIEYGASQIRRKPLQQFIKSNEQWLYPYAAFCVLRDLHPGLPHSQWAPAYRSYGRQLLIALMDNPEHREAFHYHIYTQYLLNQQLLAVRAYAEDRGVLLKGDLPIGVAPHSVETWIHPELFHLDRSAGAPPDDFAVDGQNWGFPTYNWERMQADNMLWWRNRFERMSSYFKAFRIDHILGFFRIWEIPRTQLSGLLGHFSPALPLSRAYWVGHFSDIGHCDLLFYPTIHRGEVLARLGLSAEKLHSAGLLIPIEGSQFYRLEYTEQQHYASRSPAEVIGGQATIDALVELCKEIALVEDMSQAGHFHPRISFEQTYAYKHWPETAQRRWAQLSHHYYYEVHNELWKRTSLERILPLLESTDMLVCAEDLGMIPATVPEVLDELQILSLELERMPKVVTRSGWGDLARLPYNAICTTSTHDMPPLRAWWNTLSLDDKERYIGEQLPYSDLTPTSPLHEICTAIVAAHIVSPAMLVVLPLQDWMSIDEQLPLQAPEQEQINHPENPHQRWEWRMPMTLEAAMEEHRDWGVRIKAMLLPSHRG